MAERKIRLTLSGTVSEGQSPIIDVDFDGVNLDIDLEVTAVRGQSVLVKEYTVDVAAGTYDLDITFKNDSANDNNTDGIYDEDRNLVIEKIEIANNGVDYNVFVITEASSNLIENQNFEISGYFPVRNPAFDSNLPESESNYMRMPNLAFDEMLPRSDDDSNGYVPGTEPGDNPLYEYEYRLSHATIYTTMTGTFYITFS